MQRLMEELSSTENKVAFSRQHFNDAATDYNNAREQFPHNLLAGMFDFAPASLLEVTDPAVREAPRISFT
jgi:LemA protein